MALALVAGSFVAFVAFVGLAAFAGVVGFGRAGAGCRSANSSFGAASPEPRIPATSWAAATSLAATFDSRALISPAAA